MPVSMYSSGYKCSAGSTSKRQAECGSSSVYCPGGTENPLSIPPGYYGVGASSTTLSDVLECEPGFWCANGVRNTCPIGRYGSSTKLSTSGCSGPCQAGSYCPARSTSKTQETCSMTGREPTETYCPSGTTSRIVVSNNHYTIPETGPEHGRVDQKPCPSDYVCIKGRRYLKIQFEGLCSTGIGSASIDENSVGNVVKLTARAVTSSSPISYFIDASSPTSGCPVTNPFSFQSDGTLRLTRSGGVDYEACPSYDLTIRATGTVDGSPANVYCTLTVEVCSASGMLFSSGSQYLPFRSETRTISLTGLLALLRP